MVKDLISGVSPKFKYPICILYTIYINQRSNTNYGIPAGILLDAKGSSVGALVSGPTQMRRDVAAICSSGAADNLHFESFSFTW